MSPSVDVIGSRVVAPLNDGDVCICEFNMNRSGSVGDLLGELGRIRSLYGLAMTVIHALDLHSNAYALALGRTTGSDHC